MILFNEKFNEKCYHQKNLYLKFSTDQQSRDFEGKNRYKKHKIEVVLTFRTKCFLSIGKI